MLQKSTKWMIPKRYVISVMIYIGFVNMFYLHTNLGMAVIDMTTPKNVSLADETQEVRADFNWNSKEKGIILSTFSYGRLFSPIGGLLAGKFGGSTIYGIGILVTATVTFFSPAFLYIHFNLFVITNIALGAFEAFSYAGVIQLWSRWVLPSERSRSISFSIIGSPSGSIVSFLISGWILYTWGWATLFYASGLASFAWFWIWFLVVKDDPSEDKHMSDAEKQYIKEKINCTYDNQKLVYPWKSILTCLPFWAGCLSKFTYGCAYTFTSIYLPQYIRDINDVDIKRIGYISTIPHICSVIAMLVGGCIRDYLGSHKILSLTNIHKLYISTGLFIAAIGFISLVVWSNFIVNMIAISLLQFFGTFVMIDVLALVLDLAPKYAAFLNSIANVFFTSSGIIMPSFIGFVVTSHSQFQWNICFIILSSLNLCVALIYLKFGSGELQPWANYNPEDLKQNKPVEQENNLKNV